jgi:membrane protein
MNFLPNWLRSLLTRHPFVWRTLRESASKWNQHEAMRLSASLAFYSVLSLAPLVLLTISLTGLIIGVDSAQRQVLTQFGALLGPQGEAAVRSILVDTQHLHASSIASAIGLITLLFSASQVFAELQETLDKVWEVDRSRTSGLVAIIKERFFSFGLVLSIGLLLLISLLLTAALAALGRWTTGWLPLPPWVLHIATFLVSLAGVSALFALIFKYIPRARTHWGAVWIGAVLTACLFDIGKTLIGLYLGTAAIGSTYGAAGSLVAVVLWVYYSALIFFFGAEVTHVLDSGRITREARVTSPSESAEAERTSSALAPARPARSDRRRTGSLPAQ